MWIVRTMIVSGLALGLSAVSSASTVSSDENVTLRNDLGIEFVRIDPGTFEMGSGKDYNDIPVHHVIISEPFYLSKYEITQRQYKKLMGYNPSWVSYHRDDYPVDSVSWFEAVRFCQELTKRDGRTYRLPTEAEWEYACRAGTEGMYYFGDDPERLNEFAWTSDNCSLPMPVGKKPPNPWGLHDMYGNVYEWTSNWYAIGYSSGETMTDPSGPADSTNELGTGPKVARGGCYLGRCGINSLQTERCSSTARNAWTPYARFRAIGLRIVCEIDE